MVKKLMKQIYSSVLKDSIDDEIAGRDYQYDLVDGTLLRSMLDEVNDLLGANYHYLAEVDLLAMQGSGEIMARYIDRFHSESIRAFIIPHLVLDNVDNCAEIVFRSYLRFKESSDYISMPNDVSPTHIYVRYDNAFRRIKPKAYKQDLARLVSSPRDAYYLPLTTRMVASWRLPEIEQVMFLYLDEEELQPVALGLEKDNVAQISAIRRELTFTGIEGIKYYPSYRNLEKLESYSHDPDKDICRLAKKALKYMKRHWTTNEYGSLC